MFKRLNKLLKPSNAQKAKRDAQLNKGQAAIVLLLIIAVGLIVYAVTLNIGRLSENKTTVEIASNTGAAQLASQMASYGNRLSQEFFGGGRKKCEDNGLLVAVVVLVLVVACILFCGPIAGMLGGLFSGGGAGATTAATTTAATTTATTTTATTTTVTATTTAATGSAAGAGGGGLVATVSSVASAGFALAAAAAPYVAVAAAVANVALQAAVVQPGIVDAWNSIQARTLSISESFLERGVSNALGNAVTDPITVPDVFDFDQDGVFGFDGSNPRDEISRFGLYYLEKRLKQIQPVDSSQIDIFIDGMLEFVNDDPHDFYGDGDPLTVPDGWGLHDNLPILDCPGHACCYDPIGPPVPSECNPCCVPATMPNPDQNPDDPADDTLYIRPACCDCALPGGLCELDPSLECGTAATCNEPYAGYPFVYEDFVENWENNETNSMMNNDLDTFLSFREFIGRDDEHELFFKNPATPNAPQLAVSTIPLPEDFYGQDSTGFYVEENSFGPPSPDIKKGVYPYFHGLFSKGLDLSAVAAPVDLADNLDHCYWYDNGVHDPQAECVLPFTPPPPFLITPETFNNRMELPLDPGTLLFNTTNRVDGVNPGAVTDPPLVPDLFRLPSNIAAQPTECAIQAFDDPTDDTRGFWKPGADRFCSTEWPYGSQCPHHQPGGNFCVEPNPYGPDIDINCACGSTGTDPTQFHEDILDDFAYRIPEFLGYMVSLINMPPDLRARNLSFWYVNAARWFEEGCTNPDPIACRDDPSVICYICDQQPGRLHVWLDNIQEIRDRLQDMLDASYMATGANACTEAWCVPPEQAPGVECDGVSAVEAASFDANGGNRGDLNDILACLEWNVSDNRTYADGTEANGNAEKFAKCRDRCDADSCVDLPRSLIPFAEFDNLGYAPPGDPLWQDDIDLMMSCLNDCNANFADCLAMPEFQGDSTCVEYFSQDPALFFDETTACYGDTYFHLYTPRTDFDETVQCYDHQYFTWDPATVDFEAEGCIPPPGPMPPAHIRFDDVLQQAIFAWGSGWTDDMNTLAACLSGCGNPNCQIMPQYHMIWGNPPSLFYFETLSVISTMTFPQLQKDGNLIAACLVNCSNANCQAMPKYERMWLPNTGNIWFDELWAAMNAGIVVQEDLFDLLVCNFVCSTQATTQTALGVADTWCQAMPQYATGSCGTRYFPVNPADSFTAANCQADGSPDPTWEQYIKDALIIANPSCDLNDYDGDPLDVSNNGWLLNVELSVPEAQNQVVKFQQRSSFLRNRITETTRVIENLNFAEAQFEAFLGPGGPVETLVEARKNFVNVQNLPRTAIYAWQGPEPPEGAREPPNEDEGYWHIVKVDARMIGYCDGTCGPGFGPDAADWPHIEAELSGFETCYELVDDRGTVKMRVTRFDENPEARRMFFPNDVPIWKTRFARPDRELLDDLSLLGSACSDEMIEDPGDPTSPDPLDHLLPPGVDSVYKGAVLLNRRSENINCWDRMIKLLTSGVTSETCAEYYWHGGSQQGVGFKFIPCPAGGF